MTILLIAFLATFGLIVSAGLLLFYRDAVLERLSTIVDQRLGSSRGWVGRILQPKQRRHGADRPAVPERAAEERPRGVGRSEAAHSRRLSQRCARKRLLRF